MQVAHQTDVGRRRSRNEDALLEDAEHRLFVVADGLGGHPAGHVASRRTIEVIEEYLSEDGSGSVDRPQDLATILREANREVVSESRDDPDKRGMGTTAVLARLSDDERTLSIAHIGDSRAYVLRDGDLRQVTEDHVYEGIFGRTLTQAIGASEGIDPTTVEVELEPGDRILLCTDGLTDMLSDTEIAEVLASDRSPEECCDALVERALDRGGHDNVTLIVVDPDPA